jgi:hypothetical protein
MSDQTKYKKRRWDTILEEKKGINYEDIPSKLESPELTEFLTKLVTAINGISKDLYDVKQTQSEMSQNINNLTTKYNSMWKTVNPEQGRRHRSQQKDRSPRDSRNDFSVLDVDE